MTLCSATESVESAVPLPNRKRRIELGLLVGILLLAALLRLWALDDVPPGLEHDEVANWLIARDILSGHHAIYFTAAYGHEALWQYAQAGTVALLGDNWLGLRSVSVMFGLLSIVSAYLLARRLFGSAIALSAAAWLAVSFWHLFYSRVALRAISLPALSALGAYFLWRSITPPGAPSGRPLALTCTPGTARQGKCVRSRKSLAPSARTGGAARTSESASALLDSRPAGAKPKLLKRANWESVLAGLFFGLSAYTYMAARALPFILAGLTLYLALFHHETLRRNWRGLALALLVGAIVAAPLAWWLQTHPSAEHRIGEVSEPLDRLLAGDPGPTLDNAVALLKMWSIQGDPWDRQNVPGRPVFVEPLGALLFYGGVLISLWRVRRPEYGFILIWLAGSLIPSLVTSVAPSSIRTINALAVVYIFPAIALEEIGYWVLGIGYWVLGTIVPGAEPLAPARSAGGSGIGYGRHLRLRSVQMSGILTLKAKQGLLTAGVLALALVLNLHLTVRDYFVRWPDDPGVQFVFQTALTEIARDLDADPDDLLVAIAGLSVDTMDPPTFAATLRRRDLAVRWFDAREAIIIPGGGDTSGCDQPVRLYVPRIVLLANAFRARLQDWGATTVDGGEQYSRYDLANCRDALANTPTLMRAVTLPDGRAVSPAASFGGQVELVGYEWHDLEPEPGQRTSLLTYWRVIAPPAPPLKIFVHLTSMGGEQPITQNDGLGSPPDAWQPGDLLVRSHLIDLPADISPDLYQPQIGWYNPETNERLPLLSGSAPIADRLLLEPLKVIAP